MIIQGRVKAVDVAAAYIFAQQSGLPTPSKSSLVWIAFQFLGEFVRSRGNTPVESEESAIEFLRQHGLQATIGVRRGLSDAIKSAANDPTIKDELFTAKTIAIAKSLNHPKMVEKIKAARTLEELNMIGDTE